MNNKERIEKLVLDFIDHADFEEPMKGSYRLWESIFSEEEPTMDELLELGNIGLFILTLDACVELSHLKEDMVNIEGVDKQKALDHLDFRSQEFNIRLGKLLGELFIKVAKDRIEKCQN